MYHFTEAKAAVMGGAAVIGGMISQAFGGWDAALITLLIFMAIDYVSGLIVAGVFQASDKSESCLLYTSLAAGVAEWVGANIDIEKFFQLVVSGVAALGSVKAIEMIKLLYAALDNFGTAAGLAPVSYTHLIPGGCRAWNGGAEVPCSQLRRRKQRPGQRVRCGRWAYP